MKTINKTLAFLFASFAFTACTKESIEPVRPILHVVRLDTITKSKFLTTEQEEPSADWKYGKVMTNEEFNQNQPRPQIIAAPANPAEPHTAPAQTPRPDVRPIEQLEAGNY